MMAVFGLVSSTSPPLPPGFLHAYRWQSADPLFGGFSAIELGDDGNTFTVLSDRGAFTSGHFVRNGLGEITSVVALPIKKLLGPDDQLLRGFRRDSEGLAMQPDGQAYVSFEGGARVAHYKTLAGRGIVLARPKQFDDFRPNSGLEALAIDAEGTLYTLPERSADATAPFPVFRYKNGVWDQPFNLPRRGHFLAVGADIGPDGRFYLLEREFHGLSGFSSRVRRFTFGPEGLSHEETLLESVTGQHDNLEGLSVWRDNKGFLRLTMISDDNQRFFQRTEIVEYHIPD